MTRLLILGGTGEAVDLAHAVATVPGWRVVSSLAGRAGVPDLPGSVRVGGFGGATGLSAYLRAEDITAVVDATHPFAERMSAHARIACATAGVPLRVLHRPPWAPVAGDRWIEVPSMAEAALRLPGLGRRAFLTVGGGQVGAFAGVTGVWFLVRLLALAPPPLPGCAVVVGRGPFDAEAERALMERHRIDVLVTKAAGGAATYAKIAAARDLELPVLMVRRPPPPDGGIALTTPEVVEWLSRTWIIPRG